MPVQIPQVTIEIYDVKHRELVTAIEILSPSNKRGAGYHEYLDERRRLLYSAAHLIEIDLLRQGKRIPMQEPLPAAHYFIFLGRVEKRPVIEVWPVQLTMPLPATPVPLLAGNDDIDLDLQLALNTVYDELNYDLSIDYTQPPEITLDAETAVWAVEHLRSSENL